MPVGAGRDLPAHQERGEAVLDDRLDRLAAVAGGVADAGPDHAGVRRDRAEHQLDVGDVMDRVAPVALEQGQASDHRLDGCDSHGEAAFRRLLVWRVIGSRLRASALDGTGRESGDETLLGVHEADQDRDRGQYAAGGQELPADDVLADEQAQAHRHRPGVRAEREGQRRTGTRSRSR